ncbi:Acyl-CoA synthetase (AMP-forming)/AMP-acid ligase II [Ruegeria halocynthiae]|uniref:Acyl-CoA synthetase (AMP-forming)/AMP-acid ligase II n=1 Tax=Ruegeria halocynthiae TaxID=985054 RepID=A0A1H2ZLN3_9RHOB|nr:AMP-binding protein [Ruegeria halocynthiae]SDX18256.1 Acyl-CoA synthetase (AMP-forming)/AMP-acid ligase II [Ruegeria halocynthiae]
MADLLTHFSDAVKRFPDRTAIVDGKGRQISFRDLQSRVQQLAGRWAAKGIRPGDRVLLAMPVNADLYASLAALWTLGATVVLPEPAMGLAGLRHAVRTTKPKAFCAAGAFALLKILVPDLWALPLLRPCRSRRDPPVHDVRQDDIALISFTSGTTGLPKAIPRSHAFLMAQHDAIAPLLEGDEAERDLVAFPVFTLINLASGRTSVLPNWRLSQLGHLAPAQLEDWIRTQQITRALIPPSICEKLAQSGDTAQLHTVFTGGGPVFPNLVETLRTQHGLSVVCVYGSTEAEPIAHLDTKDISQEDHFQMAAGKGLLVGYPVPNVALRIRDNEIQVAGAHVNDGYLDPAHSKENKITEGRIIWHRTGDAGALDDDGRLWLWGRIGSEIEVDKGLLFPFAIEAAAQQWPGIDRCALINSTAGPALCVQGSLDHFEDWKKSALGFGVPNVISIERIPMDKRHASKVDRAKLESIIGT